MLMVSLGPLSCTLPARLPSDTPLGSPGIRIAQSCSHVRAVQDRSLQRFTALAQEVSAPPYGPIVAGRCADACRAAVVRTI